MKLCISCRYHLAAADGSPSLATCASPKTISGTAKNPVDGSTDTLYRYSDVGRHGKFPTFCEFIRQEGNYCGPDAKLFDAKPDLEAASDV